MTRRAGDPIVFHRAVLAEEPSLDVTAGALVAELQATYADVLLLDAGPLQARRGAPAVRLLTTWREGEASRTAEHRLVAHDGVLHVLAAVTATSRYADTSTTVRRVLDRFRPGAASEVFVEHPDVVSLGMEMHEAEMHDAEMHDAEMLDVEVLRGPRPGTGLVHLESGHATVLLPGLDGAHRIPAQLAAGWLGAFFDLGPRPRPGRLGRLVTDRAALQELLAAAEDDPEPAVRATLRQPRLPADWARALTALAEPAGHWRLGPLEVGDGGAAGFWQLSPVDPGWLAGELDGAPPPAQPVALQPTDPTQVWTALTRLIRCATPEVSG